MLTACRGSANFQAALGNVLVRQASEPESTFRTVVLTHRKDCCAKVASPESDVQPCVSKPALPCRVREAQLSPCRSSAENDCTDDYVTHETTPTSPGTLGAVSGSPVVGSCILIVEFQAYIVFAIYRMIFEANIAQISLCSANIAIYRDICLRTLRQISISISR